MIKYNLEIFYLKIKIYEHNRKYNIVSLINILLIRFYRRLIVRFKITIDDNEFHANMLDYDLVNQIAEMCPFESNFKSFHGHEYFTKLPSPADDEGCPLTDKLHANKLYYHKKWNALFITFKDEEVANYKIVHIGDFEEDASEYLKDCGRNVHVICEIAD